MKKYLYLLATCAFCSCSNQGTATSSADSNPMDSVAVEVTSTEENKQKEIEEEGFWHSSDLTGKKYTLVSRSLTAEITLENSVRIESLTDNFGSFFNPNGKHSIDVSFFDKNNQLIQRSNDIHVLFFSDHETYMMISPIKTKNSMNGLVRFLKEEEGYVVLKQTDADGSSYKLMTVKVSNEKHSSHLHAVAADALYDEFSLFGLKTIGKRDERDDLVL